MKVFHFEFHFSISNKSLYCLFLQVFFCFRVKSQKQRREMQGFFVLLPKYKNVLYIEAYA